MPALKLTSTPIRLAFVPLLAFVALATNRAYLCDFWHHLARGRAIVEQGRLVNEDLFTFTVAGQPLLDVNWLTQLGYFGLYRLGGLDGVQVANALLVAAALAVAVLHAWQRSSSATVAATVGLLAFAGCWQTLTVRPQSVSMLLFAMEYAVLDLSDRRRTWLVVPPVLAAFWVNVHGAFPLAWVLVGIWLAAAAIEVWLAEGWRGLWTPKTRSLALCLAATMLATLINPYGWTVYEYVGGTSSVAASRRIDEWMPPGLTLLIGQVWLASLIVALAAFFWSPRRLSIREALLLLSFLPLAAGSMRMVVWWFLVLAPILAASVAALLPERVRRAENDEPAWSNTACAALLLLAAVMSLPALADFNPLVGQETRTEADLASIADKLRERGAAGRVFSRLEWGEYLGWSLAGRYPVFMDGRIEIIPDDVWEDYAAVTCGRDEWQSILDRYRVDHLVLDRAYHAETGLLDAVERSPHWHSVAQHGPAILYVRRVESEGE